MITQTATPGALVVDSLPFSSGGTAEQAKALKAAGVSCLVGYLGEINAKRVGHLLDAGLAFMPVTFGTAPSHYSGPSSVVQCQALGLPPGCSVWLDMEGLPAWNEDPVKLMSEVDAWSTVVEDAGFMPCLYVGVPQPLTSEQLYAVKPVRYWHGQGTVTDRKGHSAAPACGYTMVQKYPSLVRGGVLVDDNRLQADALGRLPAWVTATPASATDEPIIHPDVPLEPPDVDEDRIVQPSDLLKG